MKAIQDTKKRQRSAGVRTRRSRVKLRFPTPLLKWVGGKTQLLHVLLQRFPKHIANYHEPFVGGGSVLLAVLMLHRLGKMTISGNVFAYDNNQPLITFYKHLQKKPQQLHQCIHDCFHIYDNIEKLKTDNNPVIRMSMKKTCSVSMMRQSKESYYYYIRDTYRRCANNNSIESSALFYVLNKLGFRGLYRESRTGVFNVSFGHYKTAPICNLDDFLCISLLIRKVVFIHNDFRHSLKNANRDDFVYLDPPYAPESSSSFVGYHKDGFYTNVHMELFNWLQTLQQKKVLFVMSNADVQYVRENVKAFHVHTITARRAIHCTKPDSKAREIIVYNTTMG